MYHGILTSHEHDHGTLLISSFFSCFENVTTCIRKANNSMVATSKSLQLYACPTLILILFF